MRHVTGALIFMLTSIVKCKFTKPLNSDVTTQPNSKAHENIALKGIECSCKLEYQPVCGSDGHTYSNECILNCISAEQMKRGKPAITIIFSGTCPANKCFCPAVYEPICGTNNQTYTSECTLRCENDWRRANKIPEINIAYKDICNKATCVCPDSVIPVCGTDGRTYKNVCLMQCHHALSQKVSTIVVSHKGPCKVESCNCPRVLQEVCGSDNITYKNACEFFCYNRKRIQQGQTELTIQYKAKCVNCACNADYTPVCANNDFTYANYCQYLCTNEKRKAMGLPELLMRWKGECSCECSKDWNPVCASDRRTYSNRCLLRCENRKRYQDGRPQLSVISSAPCKNCNCDYCSTWRSPICGSDGRTYWNKCYLDCNNYCRDAVGLPRLWLTSKGECS